MSWYLAKIVFRIICGDGKHIAQFDEQLRIVNADNREEAFYKAQSIGSQEEETFFNQKQQLVQWKFIAVCELCQLNEMIDGAEMYSLIAEKEDPEQYEYILNKKAKNILLTGTHQSLQIA